jgi:hypothetical protein
MLAVSGADEAASESSSSCSLRQSYQPLPVKGNVIAPEASEMTFLRQLLAHDILKKSGMTFSVSIN